jgi:hypothetical protein
MLCGRSNHEFAIRSHQFLIVWGVASAAGWLAMAALMIMGDWTVLQGLFAAAVIFFGLGAVLSFCSSGHCPNLLRRQGWPMPNLRRRFPPWRRCGPASQRPAAKSAPAKAAASETEPAPAPTPAPTPAPAPAAADPGEGTRPAALEARAKAGRTTSSGSRASARSWRSCATGSASTISTRSPHWTADEVAWVDQNLEGFKGRVTRDNWVEQARLLASGGETEFSKKVDKGDVY